MTRPAALAAWAARPVPIARVRSSARWGPLVGPTKCALDSDDCIVVTCCHPFPPLFLPNAGSDATTTGMSCSDSSPNQQPQRVRLRGDRSGLLGFDFPASAPKACAQYIYAPCTDHFSPWPSAPVSPSAPHGQHGSQTPRSMVSSIAPSTFATSVINASVNSGLLPCCRTTIVTSCAASSTSHAKPLRNVIELHLVPMKKFLATLGTIGDRIPANFSSE
jgi:hypothetical protein